MTDNYNKKPPIWGRYLFTGYNYTISDMTPPCNIRLRPDNDPFVGIKSVPKRRMWLFLYNVGKGRFFNKSELAKGLDLTNAVAGRCIYSLKQDGIIDYSYFPGLGYCLEYVRPVEFMNYEITWGCPFGFKNESLTCSNCLFLDSCHITKKTLEEHYE